MTLIAAANLFLGIFENFLSTWMVPKGSPAFMAYGNTATCDTQGLHFSLDACSNYKCIYHAFRTVLPDCFADGLDNSKVSKLESKVCGTNFSVVHRYAVHRRLCLLLFRLLMNIFRLFLLYIDFLSSRYQSSSVLVWQYLYFRLDNITFQAYMPAPYRLILTTVIMMKAFSARGLQMQCT